MNKNEMRNLNSLEDIDKLEAKLAKAVEAFKKLDVGEGWAAQIARATLAEIEGEK
jgi:hypothetical protein